MGTLLVLSGCMAVTESGWRPIGWMAVLIGLLLLN